MRFEFATANRIILGAGSVQELAPAVKAWGTRPLVVTGRSRERTSQMLEALRNIGLAATILDVDGEPTVELVQSGVALARQESCDTVISFGGGSTIDAGKAIAALLTNPGDLMDHLEVIGRSKPLLHSPAPFIAVPTTAGTGSEVTRNAVLASPKDQVKVSLRSPLMLPRLAIVDPELTYDLPPAITASTGLDALTQLIEPYVSVRANPMTDIFCLEGIRRAARSLRRAFRDGRDAEAREDMSIASLLGGLCLANAGLGVVHGFAAPVGGMFPAPHGAVCAAILPHGMEANIRALRRRAPEGEHLRRFEDVARILTGEAKANAEQGADWVRQLCQDLGIPPLRAYGITKGDVEVLVERASHASSMKGNPIPLTQEELRQVLFRSLEG
jgi:alcohol dehydrogenase class IV